MLLTSRAMSTCSGLLLSLFSHPAVAMAAAADGDKVAPYGIRALGCLFAALHPGWYLPTNVL